MSYTLSLGALVPSNPREYIETSDQVVRDLKLPVFEQAIDIQDKIFKIADDLGLGDEVRSLIYGIRTLEYGKIAAENLLGTAGSSAVASGASALSAIGSFGALGGAVVVAALAVIGSIFGGDDEAEKRASRRRAQAREDLLHTIDRIDLIGFANEQKGVSSREQTLAQLSSTGAKLINDHVSLADHKKTVATADKLAKFYGQTDKSLSADDKAIFLSMSNLGRWEALRNSYAKTDPTTKANIILLTGGRLLDQEYTKLIGEENKTLKALLKAKALRTAADKAAIDKANQLTISAAQRYTIAAANAYNISAADAFSAKAAALIAAKNLANRKMSPLAGIGIGVMIAAVGGAAWFLFLRKKG